MRRRLMFKAVTRRRMAVWIQGRERPAMIRRSRRIGCDKEEDA